MASFNKITIWGYLGKDPEIRYMPNGDGICSFSIATTERKKDKGGEYQDTTLWFKVNVWGKQGEACNQYLSKGSQAYVCGRLSQQTYTDRDGNARTSLEVRADDVQFLDRQPQGEQQQTKAATAQLASHQTAGFGDGDGSDIQF
jgi:single-strand DNA-binding protein